MGTDYGFGCKTCGFDEHGVLREMNIIDNFRQPETLQRLLAMPPEWLKAIEDAGLHVRPDYGDQWSFDSAMTFLASHRARGHVVVVADEYGRVFGRCSELWKCPTCDAQRSCLRRERRGVAIQASSARLGLDERELSKLSHVVQAIAGAPGKYREVLNLLKRKELTPPSRALRRALDELDRVFSTVQTAKGLSAQRKLLREQAVLLIKDDDAAIQDAGRSLAWALEYGSTRQRASTVP